jgi:RNA polymerase sigma factor (sigma-70 family)
MDKDFNLPNLIPLPRQPGRRRDLKLTNALVAGGRSGAKQRFDGFQGHRRLHVTTPAIDSVGEPGEIAQGQKSGVTDRHRQARFEAIALPHLNAAYALARWMMGNDADAADVVQEAFLRAFCYFDSYRGDNARNWVLKIVRRIGYSWLDRNRPADVVSLESEDERGDAVAASAIDAEKLLENRSDLRALDRVIERSQRRYAR